MLEDEAVKIATRFAVDQGLSVGELVRVAPPSAVTNFRRWVVVLQRIDPPGMKLDPDTVIIEVDAENGEVSIEEYP